MQAQSMWMEGAMKEKAKIDPRKFHIRDFPGQIAPKGWLGSRVGKGSWQKELRRIASRR
jgi:hypothetical protein